MGIKDILEAKMIVVIAQELTKVMQYLNGRWWLIKPPASVLQNTLMLIYLLIKMRKIIVENINKKINLLKVPLKLDKHLPLQFYILISLKKK